MDYELWTIWVILYQSFFVYFWIILKINDRIEEGRIQNPVKKKGG